MRGSAHSILIALHIILLHVRLFISRSSGTMAAMISWLLRVAVQGNAGQPDGVAVTPTISLDSTFTVLSG